MARGDLVAGATDWIQIGDLPKRGLSAVSIPVRGLAPAHGIPARFVLPVVVAPAQGEVLFGPDDLRADSEVRLLQSPRYLGCMQTGMPDVGDVAGKQSIRSCPVDSVIVRNAARLPRPAQPRLFAPFGVVLDPARRVSHHQNGLERTKQSRDFFGRCGVAAQYPMGSADPEIPSTG